MLYIFQLKNSFFCRPTKCPASGPSPSKRLLRQFPFEQRRTVADTSSSSAASRRSSTDAWQTVVGRNVVKSSTSTPALVHQHGFDVITLFVFAFVSELSRIGFLTIHEFRGGGLKYPLPLHFRRNFWLFGVKNSIFSEKFWDLSRFSQICRKNFKKFWPLPPPSKNFP
jgi:hypothetical protein